ncbi:MAG: hypothetical protein ACYCT2_09585 [Thermoplasmataceae archaeon]
MTKIQQSNLTDSDISEFFRIYQNLLLFTATKMKFINTMDGNHFTDFPGEKQFEIHKFLYANIKILQEFIEKNPSNLNSNDMETVREWRNFVSGDFYLIKYEGRRGLFMKTSEHETIVYSASPLYDSFQDILVNKPPLMVNTVLLPFKGMIIYDGMISPFNIYFGPGARKGIRQEFDTALLNNGIVTSLPYDRAEKKGRTDEEKLLFYLSTKERREENSDAINRIMANSPELRRIANREMGRINKGYLVQNLKKIGLNDGWFAALGSTIVASGNSREDLLSNIERLSIGFGRDDVYIFQLK